MVPKAGGNEFSYNFFMSGTSGGFQSDNLSQDLKDRGFEFAPIAYRYSFNPAVGGPIVEDKLWFFASMIENRSQQYVLDRFWDLDEPSTPDGVTDDDLRAYTWSKNGNYNIRLTHQATQRNKFTWSYFQEPKSSLSTGGGAFGLLTPESWYLFNGNPTRMLTGRWTAPVTNRLLLEAHGSFMQADVNTSPVDHGPGVFRDAQDRLCVGRRIQQLVPEPPQPRLPPPRERVALLRDRLAQLQDRHQLRQQPDRPGVPGAGGHLPRHVLQRVPVRDPGDGERQPAAGDPPGLRLRRLRAGRVDDGPADPQRGHPVRLVPELGAGGNAGKPAGSRRS